MKTLRAWMMRLGGLFGKDRRETELAEEIESHLEMHIADNLRAGMPAEQARREALLRLGGVESVKEAYRERSTAPFLEHLMLDFRFAVRQLRKNGAFAGTAVLVLALGMCASIAIFTFVDAALIKPLPYPDAARLVAVTESAPQFPRASLSYPDYQDWKRFNTVFRSLDVYTGDGFLFNTPTGAEPTYAGRVSSGFFRTLGVKPLVGRDFLPSEELGGPRVVVLTYRTWQARFSGRMDVVGQGVALSGDVYTIIGVLPADFQFAPLGAAEFWTTLDVKSPCTIRRSCHNLDGIARLKEGVSIEGALANMTAIAKQLERQYPDSNREQGASVIPCAEAIVGNFRPILLVLMGGAGLLLLIACVNVTSLMLVRSEGRKREMAVRGALGASLARLLSQFVTESLVLVLVASALGLLSANWAMQALKSLIPAAMLPAMPFLLDLGLNGRVLAYAGALAVLAVALFSLTPALHLALSKMRDGLTEGSRGSAGKAWRRLGSRLVVVELAIAMVLLAGSGLFGKSLYRLLHVRLGCRADHLATITVAAPDIRYGNDEQSIALGRELVRKVESLPGVQSAALTTVLPVSFNGNTQWIRFVGKPYDGKHIEVNERDVSSEFFQTIGAKLARGRYFSDAEDQTKPRVVIINQTLANKYFPGEDPIGQQIGDTTLTPKSIKTIIGVVEGRAHIAKARGGASGTGSCDPSASSGCGVGSRGNHGGAYQQLDGGVSASLVGVAGGRLRSDGAAIGSGWPIRRDCLFGEPADAGDRRAHGPGGGAWFGLPDDFEGGGMAGGRGHRAGRSGFSCRRDASPKAAVRRDLVGYPDPSWRCGGDRDCGGGRELCAGKTGRVREPGGGSARGVAGSR